MVSRFPVDVEINSKIFLWRGNPWNLEVDAVVNSTNENMDKAHCSPGLHDAAVPGLAEECAKMLDVPAIKAKIERSAMLVFPIAVTTAKAHHGFGWVGEWRTPGESQIFQYLFTTGNYTAWVTGQVKI
ncbi:protein GDAP2 homolog isoform X1 [Helianthus annuus]|uniref:protein GDAP2 homolog isoform X1 n=1 Tax=Helianthus annuus TaxID=4232 RepID=UPI0016532C9F|nr:protein GDAP2 homolog isoform X1 [Helianthus annuus]